MWTPWLDIWGCGRGPVVRIAPQSRILAGVLLFAGSLTAPADTAAGIVFIAASVSAWVAACGLPLRVARSSLFLGLAMFLPYLLLTPLLVRDSASAAGWMRAFAAPWGVFWHGLAGLLVTTGTVATLSQGNLRRGLLGLRVPRLLLAVLLQIIHQTSGLLSETQRVAAAAALRGASGGKWAFLRILASLPRVWLPRIMTRSERLAAAMELRGYGVAGLLAFDRPELKAADAAAIIPALAVLILAAALRLGWIG